VLNLLEQKEEAQRQAEARRAAEEKASREAEARKTAEEKASREAEARRGIEEENARLRAELEHLRPNPPHRPPQS